MIQEGFARRSDQQNLLRASERRTVIRTENLQPERHQVRPAQQGARVRWLIKEQEARKDLIRRRSHHGILNREEHDQNGELGSIPGAGGLAEETSRRKDSQAGRAAITGKGTDTDLWWVT